MASLEIEEGIKIVSNPFELFNDWYKKAKPHPDILTPDAFCFATSSSGGLPSCRMVLMRRFSESGLSLSTGSLSRKGKDLKENPFASCCFFWEPLQYSIAAMTQGEEFGERQYFLEKRKEIVMKYSDKPVPRPVDQIAYTLRPTMFGFYQSNSMRLTGLSISGMRRRRNGVTRVGI